MSTAVKKTHRSTPADADSRLVRVNNALLLECCTAAAAIHGRKIGDRDVINEALEEYLGNRKEALLEDALQRVERYAQTS